MWRALTGGVSHSDVGVVSIRDPRFDALVELHASKKRTPLQLEFVDVHTPARTDAAAIARLREMDAIVVVLPQFGGADSEDPSRAAKDELILADLAPVESRITRARKEPASSREVSSLESAIKTLEAGRLLSEEAWEEPERAAFAHLALLTLKPILFVKNVEEDSLTNSNEDEIVLCARLEAEVAGMDPESAAELLGGYGIERRAAELIPFQVFKMLDLITFFTVNEKEARAWELRRGARAIDAAGAIHSDLERGFIRAEVSSFEDVQSAGSWDAARSAGKIRLEGKEYVVNDGDIIVIRFSI